MFVCWISAGCSAAKWATGYSGYFGVETFLVWLQTKYFLISCKHHNLIALISSFLSRPDQSCLTLVGNFLFLVGKSLLLCNLLPWQLLCCGFVHTFGLYQTQIKINEVLRPSPETKEYYNLLSKVFFDSKLPCRDSTSHPSSFKYSNVNVAVDRIYWLSSLRWRIYYWIREAFRKKTVKIMNLALFPLGLPLPQ